MPIFLTFLMWLAASAAGAVNIAWDNATPLQGQTISGTEILVDGAAIGQTSEETYAIDDSGWLPGDYNLNVRHVGTIDGSAAVSDLSNTVVHTIAQAPGVPGVAPTLRFLAMAWGA